MSEVRQALAAWEQHLEEVIGVVHSTQVVDRFDQVVTPELLEVTVQRIRMERQADLAALRGELLAELRGETGALSTGLVGEMGTLSSELRGEMGTLSTDLRGEMATLSSELRGEMATLSSELRGEMATLSADLHAAIADCRQELSDKIERTAASWRRDLLLVTGAQFTALAGAVLVLA